ncbi:MAG TPA: peptidylprolyl isomerase [Acidimicrobiia bacterium]
MPKATKRERQRQNRDARRVAVMEAQKRRRRLRSARNLAFLLVPLLILFFVLQLTRGGNNSTSKATKNGCSTAVPPKPTTTTLAAAPAMTIDPTKQYTAVMTTSCGTITIALDARDAPQTVNSFAYLANKGFYNGTRFHRVVADFVDQGGDPTGTGSGDPGYKLPDEPPATGYAAGSVAMANAGTGTTGSQFFLVVSDSGAQRLGTAPPYKYSALGTMDATGLKVAKKINGFAPKNSTGTPPTQKVYVTNVKVTEGGSAASTTAPTPTTAAR